MTEPKYVFHVLFPLEWEEFEKSKIYRPRSLETEGFIHFSLDSQLHDSIRLHFPGVAPLTVLRVKEAALGGDLRYEEGRAGELFPHLYRGLSLAEVSSAFLLERIPGWEQRLCSFLSDSSL